MNIKNICRFILVAFCAIALCATVPASTYAGLATVGAVHDYVQKKWGVTIPRTHADSNLINMNYLMQLIDAANLALNGWVTSDFADHTEYATQRLAGAASGKEGVNTLIEKVEWKFFFTPAATTNEYSFNISAAGHFYIDWGDGEKEFICKKDVNVRTISHAYAVGRAASEYEIKLGGHATQYSTGQTTAAISFSASAAKLSAMHGCLGCVFSTIDNERVAENQRQPRFYYTFANNSELTQEIPEELFNGVHGAPVSYMFANTFNKVGMSGTIPVNLFSGIKGAPAQYMFSSTFADSRNFTTLPEGLFAGIKGAPVAGMFNMTFYLTTGLTGTFPQNLFAGIKPSDEYAAFSFYVTFHSCNKLKGESALIDGKYLYEYWPEVPNLGGRMYEACSGLTDYLTMPKSWTNR